MNTIILQFQQRSTHNGTHSKLLHNFKPRQHLMQLLKSYDHLCFHKKGRTQKKKNVALFSVLQNKDDHLLIFVGLYLISANRLTSTDGWTTTTSHRLAPYIANSSKNKTSRHAHQLIKLLINYRWWEMKRVILRKPHTYQFPVLLKRWMQNNCII